MHQKALSIFKSFHGEKHPLVANVLYEIATDHCLQHNTQAALASLKEAVKAGLHLSIQVQEDADLDSIREESKFKTLANIN